MKFYDKLYVGDSIQNANRIRRRLLIGAGLFGIYLITLSDGPDQLDIFSCVRLKEKHFDRKHLTVVGLAGSMGEAFGLVERIAEDSVAFGTDGNLKAFLQQTDRSRKGKLWR